MPAALEAAIQRWQQVLSADQIALDRGGLKQYETATYKTPRTFRCVTSSKRKTTALTGYQLAPWGNCLRPRQVTAR